MDESISAVPARVTRSRRASVESPASPARKTRARKLKNINEKEEESVGERRNSVDDFDDAASNASSGSVKSCHVVLRRENFDGSNTATDDRSVAHSTRARRSSQLTEENISAAYSNASQRSLRSGSVISEGTESTRRSTRLAQSQNTPKKESAMQPSTPARRSSRLLSETAAESPAKNTPAKITPARRNTRNSVISIASEDSPPQPARRASSRLAEHGTPKSLKTKASKIKSEPTTPRRASTRINKSIIATEIIDEESDEDEKPAEKVGKSKQATKLSEDLIIELNDEDNKSDVEMEVTESKASKDGDKRTAEDDDNEPIIIEDAVDVKPVLSDEQKSASTETVTSSSDMVKSPRVETSIKSPIAKTTSVPMSPVVLISTTTSHSPKLNASLPKAQTPTVEPSEPMETSMTEAQTEPTGTPKGKAQNVIESSKTPQINTPKTKAVASDLDSMDVTAMVNESILSPTPSKSKEGRRKSIVSAPDTTQKESEAIECDNPVDISQTKEATRANVSRVESESANDVEEMEVDTEAAPEAENNAVIEKVIVSNKPLEIIKRSESSTPKSKGSASAANDSFDISPLAQADEGTSSTPQSSKKSSKRHSLNESIQSTGFDQMEVTILADESTKKKKKSKSATPKKMDSSKVEESPKPTASFGKANTSKSSAKTPQKDMGVDEDEDDEDMFDETSDTPKNQTPNLLRPPRESTFGIVSLSLREQLDDLVSTLYTPEAPKQNDRSKVETKAPVAIKEIDRQIDEIAEAVTPSDPEVLDQRFEEIASKSISSTSKPDEPQSADAAQEATNENVNESTSSKDKEVSVIEEGNVSKVDETQPESDSTATTKTPQKETASTSKSERKSVQIMTPVVDEKQKMAMKRIDTPYPNDKSISEATAAANRSKSDERKKKQEEARAKAREELNKLRDSWSKSIKRNSLSSESPKPIDKLGVADTSANTEEQPAKKAVPARNNWSHLVDSESEPDEDELVPESEVGESQDEEEDESGNEFVDDDVEVAENYESGDSMDEDERREIEENAIETGLDIGSEDTEDEDEEDEDEEDEYEDDGFIVPEGEETDASITSESEAEEEEEEENVVVAKKPARRPSRIIQPSSSEEESNDESIANVNEIVAVSVELVPQSVVVIHANATDAEELIEGKTFPTTYFTPSDEEEKSKKTTKETESSAKTDVAEANCEVNEEKSTDEIRPENEASEQSTEPSTSAQTTEPSTTATANVSIREEEKEIVSEKEQVDQPAESEKLEKEKESETDKVETPLPATATAPVVESEAKENQTVPKKTKHRTSLPGIERLTKSTIVKKNSRVSLGDLDPNTQNFSISSFKTQPVNTKTKNRASIEIAIQKDESPVVSVNLKSNEKNASLNTSAPEENNNNEKASKKAKVVIQIQSDENIPTESVVEINTVTSTTENAIATSSGSGNKTKSKRKFIEVDMGEEVQQRSAKPRKLLRIINSASGQFIEEPMTPEKNNKFGFKEMPRTPTNHAFKVEKRVKIPVLYQPCKRKSIYLSEDDDIDLLLPQPKWKINTQFEETQPKKRARKLDLGSTEVIIAPAVPTKKKKSTYYPIPAELARYRENILHRAGIPRQNSRALLRERQKRMTYK